MSLSGDITQREFCLYVRTVVMLKWDPRLSDTPMRVDHLPKSAMEAPRRRETAPLVLPA